LFYCTFFFDDSLPGGIASLPFSTEDLSVIIPRLHYTSGKADQLQKAAEGYWKRELLQRLRIEKKVASFMAIIVFCGLPTSDSDKAYVTVRYYVPALSLTGTFSLVSVLILIWFGYGSLGLVFV
jgi:hypothetical protein